MAIDPDKIIVAICGLVILVVGVNAGLWAYYRRSNPGQQAKGIQKAAKRAQAPWGEEDENLKKLNQMVNDLRQHPPEEPPSGPDHPKRE